MEQEKNKNTITDKALLVTMIIVIVSVWAVFLLTVGIQVKAAREANKVIPMLSMDQVMTDVDEIFTEEQAEIIHYIYECSGAATINVDPYNTNVWYVRFVVGVEDGGCAGIAYGYTAEDGWQYWDWGWPDSSRYVEPWDYAPEAVG